MNLPDLLPDIIKLILHMDEDSLDNVRSISPLWNCSVVEYLREPRYKFPLKEVELRCRVKKNPEEDNEISMMLEVPIHCLGRLKLIKWLRVFQTKNSVVSLMTDYQNIDVVEEDGINSGVYRFTRFFSLFDGIDTLILEKFDDWSVLKNVMSTILNSKVTKLDIVTSNVQDQAMPRHILDVIEQHEIRHVSIDFENFSLNSSRFLTDDFILQLTTLKATLCLFERELDPHYRGPGWGFEYRQGDGVWEQAAETLGEQGISIRLALNGDAGYDRDIKTMIRAHLNIMTKEQRKGGLGEKLMMERKKRGW